MEKLVLFGAGHHTSNYIRLLEYFHCKVDFIADNDTGKTGGVCHGIPVIDAPTLIGLDCRILISCTYWKEITGQLSELGIADKRIGLREILEEILTEKTAQLWKLRKSVVNSKKKICIDLYSPAAWGGAENWNYSMAKELAKAGCDIRILASPDISIEEPEAESGRFSIRRFRKEDCFADMVKEMMEQLPIVFLNCFTEELFFAALAVKMIYPNEIQIIDEVHLGCKQSYDLHVQFDDFIDRYICVSSRIKETLKTAYGIQEERLFFKEQPIKTDETFQKRYAADSSGPIRIGYAARLVKKQKRADLLPVFLEQLRKRGINYRLEIAGGGEEEDKIKRELKQCGEEDHVKFLGCLGYSEMEDFWKRQDVYINFSEFEGASLAMLEAMSFGCVPIVTDVSGASDYIVSGRSGYICAVGDLEAMAQRVLELYQHRILLKEYGNAARESVLSKCSKENYAKTLRQWIGEMK